jgi:hypothetical protein
MIRSLNNFPRIGDCKSKKSWCMQKGKGSALKVRD